VHKHPYWPSLNLKAIFQQSQTLPTAPTVGAVEIFALLKYAQKRNGAIGGREDDPS